MYGRSWEKGYMSKCKNQEEFKNRLNSIQTFFLIWQSKLLGIIYISQYFIQDEVAGDW